MALGVRGVLQRFFVPPFAVSLYYFLKFRAKVSPRAEVELTGNIRMGKGPVIGSFTKVKATEGPLVFGRRCGIATGCFISVSSGGVRFGDHAIVGPNVNIDGRNYVTEQRGVPLEDQGHTSKGVTIGRNVWIGAGCTVLDGSHIGDDTIVVANSLVNRRFPPGVILQGNPAKIIFRRPAAEGAERERESV